MGSQLSGGGVRYLWLSLRKVLQFFCLWLQQYFLHFHKAINLVFGSICDRKHLEEGKNL